jgi:hypothetical protein
MNTLFAKVNILDAKAPGLWTLKVFVDNKFNEYEVQIFRGENNVRDTPFEHRGFFKEPEQVEQFIKKFQEWAFSSKMEFNTSFDDLKFVNGVAVISKNHPKISEYPESNVKCILEITERPEEGYYDCSYYSINTVDETSLSHFKLLYCEKNDITHYMRWFTQWLEFYNDVEFCEYIKNDYSNPDEVKSYLSWVSDWTRF